MHCFQLVLMPGSHTVWQRRGGASKLSDNGLAGLATPLLGLPATPFHFLFKTVLILNFLSLLLYSIISYKCLSNLKHHTMSERMTDI